MCYNRGIINKGKDMSKVNLILRAIACGSVLLTGGSAVYHLSQPEPEIVVEAQQEDPNKTVTDNGHGTTTVTINPGDSHYTPINNENKTEGNKSTSNTTTKPNSTPKPTQPATPATPATPTTQPSQPTTPTYTYSAYHIFEQAYIGSCQQDIPTNAYYGKIDPAATLGYNIKEHGTYRDLDSAAIYAWNLSRTGFGGQLLLIQLQRWTNLNRYALRVNPSTRKVTWENTIYDPNFQGPSAEIIAQLDTLVAQLESKMAQLDQRLYAKCGY